METAAQSAARTPHSCTAGNDEGSCENTGNGGATGAENTREGNGENVAEHALNEATACALPFTGENLLKVVLVGLAVAGLGLALNLRARRES